MASRMIHAEDVLMCAFGALRCAVRAADPDGWTSRLPRPALGRPFLLK